MRISEIELFYTDLEWFAIDKNKKIMCFTSGGYGNVPEFVCASKENTDLLIEFFENAHDCTTAIVVQDEKFGQKYLDYCRAVSSKGLYYFDAVDGQDDTPSYTKISVPEQPLYFHELPPHIQSIIGTNFVDTDADTADTIIVDHAY